MTPVPRIIDTIQNLSTRRKSQLIDIFSTVSFKKRNINVFNPSLGGSLIFSISDGKENGSNFKDWRFQTISESITAGYHEVWRNLGKEKYFLERSYFHLYMFDEEEQIESEYVLLHCDASEPNNTEHCEYKQSPHLHFEKAQYPIPKAHIALYNGRVHEVLSSLVAFNSALSDAIKMLETQILNAHPPYDRLFK